VLARGALEGLADAEWQALVALAARQRVRPLLRRRLLEDGSWSLVPPPVRAALDRDCRRIALRTLRFQAETAALARDLAARGVPMMVLKGVHLASGIYESPGLREMNDIDVMVRREHLPVAAERVRARGYETVTSTSIEVDTLVSHHLTRAVRRGTANIEVHWTLFKPGRPWGADPDGLWNRAAPATVGGVSVLALGAEDLLLHLCGHASHQHAFRMGLRPLLDVASVLERHGPRIDWAALATRADACGWGRGAYLTLSLASSLLGAEVPASALAGLRPEGSWRDEEAATESARALMFERSTPGRDQTVHLSRLVDDQPFAARVRHLVRRVILPRAQLASLYGLPLAAPRRVYALHYLRRLFELTARHTRTAVAIVLLRRSPARRTAQRLNVIEKWMNETTD
jgi:hypothetical protein